MKKIIITISLFIITLMLASCNQDKLEVGIFGDYDKNTKSMISDLLIKDNKASQAKNIVYKKIKNIDDAFLQFTNNKIDLLISDVTSSKYFCSRYNDYTYKVLNDNCAVKYSFCFSEDSKYLLNDINEIIGDFKEERFFESINNIYVTSVIDNDDPTFIDLVKIPSSSQIYRVGFTGNLPPIDLVDEKDRPCGYSNKILNEIAKRLKANLILVKLDSDTKIKSLNNHDVDFLYEVITYNDDCGEVIDGLYSSIPYYQSIISYIMPR